MKRFAIITGRDPKIKNDLDGAVILVDHLTNQLRRRQHLVDIFTPQGYTGTSRQTKKETIQQAESHLHSENGTRIIRFKMPLLELPQTQDAGRDMTNRITISRAEADFFSDGKLNDYDAVFIIHMAHAFGIFERGLVPLERTVVFPMMLGSFYSKYLNISSEYLDAERKVLQVAKLIQTPSEAEKNELVNIYGCNKEVILVVPRGFDNHLFQGNPRKLSSGQIRIICANAVRMQKGQHILIPTARELRKLGVDAKFVITGLNGNTYSKGYNQYAEDFAKSIQEQKLEDSFSFQSVVPQNDLVAIMNSCHMAVYPSTTETFGKSALESMAFGLPTFVFDDVEAFSEFMEPGKSGIFVRRDPTILAHSIAELSQNPERYNQISSNGINQGKKFACDAVIGRLIKEIEARICQKC